MKRWGLLRGKEDNLVKDLKETTFSLRKLGKKYGVSRQTIYTFFKRQRIRRPKRPRGHQTGECRLCQKLIQISKKPQSKFISIHTILEETGESKEKCLSHLRMLRDKRLVGRTFGRFLSKDRISDEDLKEIFPKKFNRSRSSEQVYAQLKKMILSGKLKKGKNLAKEEIAHTFNVSRTPVIKAYSRLEKDGLIIIKGRSGSFVA